MSKISDALKRYYANPENRKKASVRMKKYFAEHPEAKANRSALAKERVKDKDYLNKLINIGRSYWQNEKNRKAQRIRLKAYNERNPALGNRIIKKDSIYVKVLAKCYPKIKGKDFGKYGLKNKKFKYILESHKVWYDAGNKLPKKGEVLYHLDGNYKNNDVHNLQVISRGVLSVLSKKKRHTDNKDTSNSNILLTKLELKINQKLKRIGIDKKRKNTIINRESYYDKKKNYKKEQREVKPK